MELHSKYNKSLIVKNRLDLFKDFTINLTCKIHAYYLGNDVLNNEVDIKNHFNWCYDKICDDFALEDLYFYDNKDLRDYFYEYFYDNLYKINIVPIPDVDVYIKYWNNVFKLKSNKNVNWVKMLSDLYEIFNETIESK